MMNEVTVKQNQVYRHYKGNYYQVLYLAINANDKPTDGKKVVVYQGLYKNEELGDNPVFTRSLSEFTGYTSDGVKRFVLFQKLFAMLGETEYIGNKQLPELKSTINSYGL